VTAWNSLKIGTKLSLGFGVILAIIATIAVISFSSRTHLAQKAEVQARFDKYRQTFLQTEVSHYQWLTSIAISTFQGNLANCPVESSLESCALTDWLREQNREDLEKSLPETEELLSNIEKSHMAMHTTYSSMKDGHVEKTSETLDSRQVFVKTLQPKAQDFVTQIDTLLNVLGSEMRENTRAIDESMVKTKYMFLYLFVATLVIGFLLSLAITRSVAPPLRILVDVADDIAAGELKQWQVRFDRSDEIGDLYHSFSRMYSRLLEIAQILQKISEGQLTASITPASSSDVIGTSLETMLKNLRDLAGSIATGATTLAAASAETSVSAAQLSASTTESAAAISETTATMEEVRQTASIMNNNASSVAENARQGGVMANQSRERVRDIADAIKLISSRMDFIAQHTVQLSEKSQKIGEIISVVNDIADQSNILAVNASIEAAKAGEEGKGFAVLAEEIRNLAEQSKQATKEIKAILDDIQKATSATVMATEEGSKAVAKGEQQAETVSKVILDLASSVSNSSRSADTIAGSAREQLKGIEQVTQAMESIRTASQQNKESARQLDETSSSMKSLGQDLMRLVQRFKL
jgi:methyl-accepting chemotaxis protein